MNIEKAIEILTSYVSGYNPDDRAVFKDALQLGIEALKREKGRRHSIYWCGAALLPGETQA